MQRGAYGFGGRIGSPADTALVSDLNPGPAGSNPRAAVVAGDTLYFIATTPQYGAEPWAWTP